MTPTLDIIIVNFNTREDVLACLESVFASPPAGLARVFLVDSASADGSADAVRSAFPTVEVIALERNVGFGAANNVAMRLATADLLLLLNSDTLVPAGAIERLVARLTATGAVAAGPRLVDAEGRPEISFGSTLSPRAEAMQLLRTRLAAMRSAAARRYVASLVSHERAVDWVSGACLLVQRTAAIHAGLFDERYFLYEEDVDFCAALRRDGGRVIFAPAAQVVHLRGRSGAPAGDHYDESHLKFYEKHAPGWVWALRLWQRLRAKDGVRFIAASGPPSVAPRLRSKI